MSVPTTRPTTLTRRSLLQIFGVGAGVAALAACAPSGGSATTPTSAGTATAGGAAENFSFASGSYPYNEYLNQLTLQVRGGQFAGAAQVDVAWLGSLAALGKLQDLSGLASGRATPTPRSRPRST